MHLPPTQLNSTPPPSFLLSLCLFYTCTHVCIHVYIPTGIGPVGAQSREGGPKKRQESGDGASGYPDPLSPILDSQIHLIANPLVILQAKNDYLP